MFAVISARTVQTTLPIKFQYEWFIVCQRSPSSMSSQSPLVPITCQLHGWTMAVFLLTPVTAAHLSTFNLLLSHTGKASLSVGNFFLKRQLFPLLKILSWFPNNQQIWTVQFRFGEQQSCPCFRLHALKSLIVPSNLTNIKFFRSREQVICIVLVLAIINSHIFVVHLLHLPIFQFHQFISLLQHGTGDIVYTVSSLGFLYYKISTAETIFCLLCLLLNIHTLQEDESSPFRAVVAKGTHLGSLF